MKRKYPKEIYHNSNELNMGPGRNGLAVLAEDAYDLGFSNGHTARMSMNGFSSLSRAHGEGVMIDWGQLGGKIVRITSRKLGGFFEYRLQRNSDYAIDNIYGWLPSSGEFPAHMFNNAIKCFDDMELFIEGEIPVVVPTADKFPAGTFFAGCQVGDLPREYVRYDIKRGGVTSKRVASLFSDKDGPAKDFTVFSIREGGVVETRC